MAEVQATTLAAMTAAGAEYTSQVLQRVPQGVHDVLTQALASCREEAERRRAAGRREQISSRPSQSSGDAATWHSDQERNQAYGLGFDDPATWRPPGGGPDAGQADQAPAPPVGHVGHGAGHGAVRPQQPASSNTAPPPPPPPPHHPAPEATQLAITTPRAPPPPVETPTAHQRREHHGRRRAPKHDWRTELPNTRRLRRELAKPGAHIPAGHRPPPDMEPVACADLAEMKAREQATRGGAPVLAAPGAAYWFVRRLPRNRRGYPGTGAHGWSSAGAACPAIAETIAGPPIQCCHFMLCRVIT